jgi:hypothetical protein
MSKRQRKLIPKLIQKQEKLNLLQMFLMSQPGNTKGGSIFVLLASCLTGLELAV